MVRRDVARPGEVRQGLAGDSMKFWIRKLIWKAIVHLLKLNSKLGGGWRLTHGNQSPNYLMIDETWVKRRTDQ
jgi:hypothetical protein